MSIHDIRPTKGRFRVFHSIKLKIVRNESIGEMNLGQQSVFGGADHLFTVHV